MRASLAALGALLSLGCASTQVPAAQGDRSPGVEFVLRLEADEDPAHALAVATRRLGAAGLTRADITAVTGALSVRLPLRDHARARAVLLATPWLRGRYLDPRVDLRPLASSLPPGMRLEREVVTLMPGFDVTEAVIESDAREALMTHIAATPSLAGAVVAVQTPTGAWRARALLPAVMARGAELTGCRAGTAGFEVILERGSAPSSRPPRRWAVELSGVYLGVAVDESRASVTLRSRAEVDELLAQCALGLLGGPVSTADQSPSSAPP